MEIVYFQHVFLMKLACRNRLAACTRLMLRPARLPDVAALTSTGQFSRSLQPCSAGHHWPLSQTRPSTDCAKKLPRKPLVKLTRTKAKSPQRTRHEMDEHRKRRTEETRKGGSHEHRADHIFFLHESCGTRRVPGSNGAPAAAPVAGTSGPEPPPPGIRPPQEVTVARTALRAPAHPENWRVMPELQPVRPATAADPARRGAYERVRREERRA